MNMKCECPELGEVPEERRDWYDEETEWPFVNHKPGKCKCTNDLAIFEHSTTGDRKLLCSCCNMTGGYVIKICE